jgi:REP element-mobilizing transposase RayT
VSEYIHKKHNVSVLLYHLVCPAKYRQVVFTEEVDKVLKEVCMEISKRYEIKFIEIGTDDNHVHFLIQTVPMYSPSRLSQVVKSITAREVFGRVPEVKKKLWGGEFWTKGYFINTVGKHGNEEVIRNYVREQGQDGEYIQIHRQQMGLFDI